MPTTAATNVLTSAYLRADSDPQIARGVDLRGDLDEVVPTYEAGSRNVEELYHERSASSEGHPTKRKRRFWPW